MLENWRDLPREDRVIIALDCEADKALSIAYQLRERAKWVKVGMTLFYKYGPDIVKILKDSGYNVFLDLKFLDIPHQVRGAAKSAAMCGADMVTMHACGGVEMMRAALDGIDEAADAGSGAKPSTLGITVLTSMNDEVLHSVGVDNSTQNQVERLAKLAKEAQLSGVVASPLEAKMLRGVLGSESLIVTPGVRQSGSDVGDQSRVATPNQAFEDGASHIVVGRPVTGSDDFEQAFERICEGL